MGRNVDWHNTLHSCLPLHAAMCFVGPRCCSPAVCGSSMLWHIGPPLRPSTAHLRGSADALHSMSVPWHPAGIFPTGKIVNALEGVLPASKVGAAVDRHSFARLNRQPAVLCRS